MPYSSVFGPIFVAATLEQDVIDLLKKWFPDYIKEIEYQLGKQVGVILPPKHYTTRNNFASLPGEQNPRCVVISPGLAAPPVMGNNQSYRATWGVGIGLAIAHNDEATANLLSKVYGAAARAIMEHHASEIPNLFRITYQDENYDDVPVPNPTAFYKGAVVYFNIEINNVLTLGLGPSEPDPTYVPPAVWPEVQDVVINIVKEAI